MKNRHAGRWNVLGMLSRFWLSDRGLSIFSALLIIVIFVLPPLLPPGGGRSILGDVLFALLLIAGVRSLGQRRLAWMVLMPVTVVTVAVYFLSHVAPVGERWVELASLVSMVCLLFVVLNLTLRDGPITSSRIQGAVAAYLLLGVIWANAYSLVALVRPGAFLGPVHPEDGMRGWLYFSFITLTTVGYGDINPVHPAARSLAILEAVTGPLYLAILLARLVSLAVVPGQSQRPGPTRPAGTD